jgi:hypothetical protein
LCFVSCGTRSPDARNHRQRGRSPLSARLLPSPISGQCWRGDQPSALPDRQSPAGGPAGRAQQQPRDAGNGPRHRSGRLDPLHPPVLQSRTSSTPRGPSRVPDAAASRANQPSRQAVDETARVAACGQSGQRRAFAQDGSSAVRAVAGAASATSAAASSPPRKRVPRRRRCRPRPGRGMSPFALAGPAMPDGTKRSKDTLGLTPERVSGVPPRGLEMCLAQADSTPMAVLRNRGGRPAVRGSRPPRAMIARGRAGAPRTVHATAQARRASGQARP